MQGFARVPEQSSVQGKIPPQAAIFYFFGGLAERFKARVLKTRGRKPSQVRILYPPPRKNVNYFQRG